MKDETTQIFLIPAEAQQFLTFQQNYEPISVILQADIFRTRNGSITLHFDSAGTLQKIDRHDNLYVRGK